MAFRGLVEGDCGNPSSLIRLTSHYMQDHGLREEEFHLSRGPPMEPVYQMIDTKLLRFLREPACPQTFRMDNLIQEVREIDKTINPPIRAPDVAIELADLDVAWNNACLTVTEPLQEFRANNITNLPVIQLTNLRFHTNNTHELDPKWAEEYVEQRVDANGDSNNVMNEDPNVSYSKFMKFMRQEGDISESSQIATASLDDSIEKWIEQFHVEKQKMDDTINSTSDHAILNKMEDQLATADTIEKWIEQFHVDKQKMDDTIDSTSDHAILNKAEDQLAAAGMWMDEFVKENPNTENNLDSTYESTWDRLDEMNTQWMSDYNATFNKEYEFCKTNPMKDSPNALAEGKRRLEMEDLPSAVLCFEAAVQQDENNVEAWLLLGKTQAENEQDPLAISALNRCLSLDPSNSVALMTLAASYANESFQKQACLTLKEWLLKNEKYMHLSASESALKTEQLHLGISTLLFDQVYDEVKDLYLQAARMNPRDGIDADVQCGLGILFNLYSEYDKAADCFRAALQVRPEDSRLWNKLGATLANGQRPAEAINVYHRALELSPGFIRARYNLGVSCVTLCAYKEAAEHLLTVLNQQAAGMGPEDSEALRGAMSNSIWTTLRFVILFMNRYDLMKDVESRNLSSLNEEFGVA